MTRPQKPPVGLASRGRSLWADIIAGHELRPDELTVLEEACREVDLIDVLQTELVGADSLTVRGSHGQPAPHPMVTELRQHRTTLRQLLAQLRLTDADDDDPAQARARSELGRRGAAARWSH